MPKRESLCDGTRFFWELLTSGFSWSDVRPSVNPLLLTSQTFPAKAPWQEVEISNREPFWKHIGIVQLSMQGSRWDGYDAEQVNILKKAASLLSNAVVFAKPEKHVEHGSHHQGPMMLGVSWGRGMYGYPGRGYGGGDASLADTGKGMVWVMG